MAGLSVRFDTRVYDGYEVIILYYRVDGVLGCRFFTGVCDSRADGVCSAMVDMMVFVFRLMGCGVGVLC